MFEMVLATVFKRDVLEFSFRTRSEQPLAFECNPCTKILSSISDVLLPVRLWASILRKRTPTSMRTHARTDALIQAE